jgi:hypothetical protein
MVLAIAALAAVGVGCSDPCGDLKAQCEDCGDAKSLCEATVDLTSEIGGDDACQEYLDQGGIECSGQGGGS